MSDDAMRILYQGAAEGDLRFQFEVIKQLAESQREQTASMRGMQETMVKMLERLARIEEHRTHEAVAAMAGRVDMLERDRDQRTGAAGQRSAFLSWWGPITWTMGIVFTVLFLLLRATGILHLPDPKDQPPVVRQEQPAPTRATGEKTE